MNTEQQRQKLIAQVEAVLHDHGDVMTMGDLIDLARAGRVQIFGRDDALIASEILAYPRRKICNAIVAAGNLRSILDMEKDVEAFARAQGADGMVTHGRPGWGRVGQRTGWKLHSLCYVKSLARLNGGGR